MPIQRRPSRRRLRPRRWSGINFVASKVDTMNMTKRLKAPRAPLQALGDRGATLLVALEAGPSVLARGGQHGSTDGGGRRRGERG